MSNNQSNLQNIQVTKVTNEESDLISKSKKFLDTRNNFAPTNNSKPQINSDVSIKGLTNILDALLSKGFINIEQYNSVKFEAINSNQSVDQIIIKNNLATQRDLVKLYSEMRGIPYIDLTNINISPETLQALNQEIALSNMAIAFEILPTKVKVAMKDPLDLQKIKYIQSVLGKPIEAYYSSEEDIKNIIETRYGAQIGAEVDQALEEVGGNTLNVTEDNYENIDSEDAPIIRIVNMVMDYGIKNKASDIHIEPREGKVGVRFRIRGILSEKLTIPLKLLSAVVTRIKILSDLKIDEHRIPQDGRFQVKTQDNTVDVRVSVMPSVFGEKIVMRLLEKTKGIQSLENIGVSGISLKRIKDAIKKTQGIILVTGPTGSGKSTTIASFLKELNKPEVNLVTLEDPVELKVDGVNQVQVNPEVGLTFANGLRAILRQDPDIIMVGEIRDKETASLAVQAALVGRLVLSTLHTNSAAGSFVRLIDMGVEPFLLTSTVNLVIAQRLVRVLCECKEPYEANSEFLQNFHEVLDELGEINVMDENHNVISSFNKNSTNLTLYKAVGCPKCGDSGYISRTGIFESLKMSDDLSSKIMRNASISEINNQAKKEGMLSLIQDGFIKALQGITTVEEVLRVKNE